jgi:hypothetical protein
VITLARIAEAALLATGGWLAREVLRRVLNLGDLADDLADWWQANLPAITYIPEEATAP